MRKIKQTIVVGMAAAMLLSIKSFAMTSIQGINLYLDSAITEGTRSTDVSVYTTSNRYEVQSVVVNNVPSQSSDGWKESAQPKLTIKLKIEDKNNFRFGNVKKDDVVIYADQGDSSEASVTSVSKDEKAGVLTIKYTMAPLDSMEEEEYDLYTHDTSWDTLTGTAHWDSGADAKYYKLNLFRGNETAASVSTTNTSFCFAKYFTKGANYKFTVQAYRNSNKKGNVASSSVFKVSTLEAKDIVNNYGKETDASTNVKDTASSQNKIMSSAAGGPGNTAGSWQKNDRGWWFVKSTGGYPINQWEYINGRWYYFDNEGYMKTGWQNIDNQWYYLDPVNGDMWVSRKTPDGYNLDASGKMVSNSAIISDQTSTSGSWQKNDRGWWYLYSDGTWAQGCWKMINGAWYYFDKEGYIKTGWQNINNQWYYLDPVNGDMWHDRMTPDGYYLNAKGKYIR
ncbi:MAG: hypothetical protein Q4P22_05680 [Eubacteriales bacterium]|nr:hypothetical protein [Eubacteriales bacterium]